MHPFEGLAYTLSQHFEQMKGRFDFDLKIAHHFLPGIYAKEMTVPAGHVIGQHAHKTAHKSSYIGGPGILRTDAGDRDLPFPAGTFDVPAHIHHQIIAKGEMKVFCIWETDETDPEKIDEMVKE